MMPTAVGGNMLGINSSGRPTVEVPLAFASCKHD